MPKLRGTLNIMKPNLYFIFCLTLSLLSFAVPSFSRDQETILPPGDTRSLPPTAPLSSKEIFERTQAVLNYYHVPPEADPSSELSEYQGVQTSQNIQNLLKWFNPTNFFQKIGTLTANEISIFQDVNSKDILDAKVSLRSPTSLEPLSLSLQPQIGGLPLTGLRIALDPGHMGGKFWDELTGKYVSDRIGAQVMLTHEGLTPVTKLDYKTFDLTPFAQSELQESIHTDWFQNLIASAPIGPDLYRVFDQSSQRRKLFSNESRDKYFILRADLWARAELINQFNPHIVLIIHYDTDDSGNSAGGLNPRAPKQTKAFVVGGYQKTELGSRTARKNFLRHLVDQNSWDQSLLLSRKIVGQLHNQLGLSLARSADLETYPIEPGVLARNLMIPRFLKAPAISYLECTFFNNPDEFYALANTKHPLMIDGKNMPYSDRLLQIVNAIRDGVLEFVSHQQPQN